MKKIVKILIAAVLLVTVVSVAGLVIYNKMNPLKTEAVIANLEWGMSSMEAKQAMAREGHLQFEFHEIGQNAVLVYDLKSYQGIEGADYRMQLYFTDDKLNTGSYIFTTSSDFGRTALPEEMLDELQLQFAKTYERGFERSISDTINPGAKPEDPDFGRYYVGDKSLVYVARQSSGRLEIRFEDMSAEDIQQYVWALGVLEEEYLKNPEQD